MTDIHDGNQINGNQIKDWIECNQWRIYRPYYDIGTYNVTCHSLVLWQVNNFWWWLWFEN